MGNRVQGSGRKNVSRKGPLATVRSQTGAAAFASDGSSPQTRNAPVLRPYAKRRIWRNVKRWPGRSLPLALHSPSATPPATRSSSVESCPRPCNQLLHRHPAGRQPLQLAAPPVSTSGSLSPSTARRCSRPGGSRKHRAPQPSYAPSPAAPRSSSAPPSSAGVPTSPAARAGQQRRPPHSTFRFSPYLPARVHTGDLSSVPATPVFRHKTRR